MFRNGDRRLTAVGSFFNLRDDLMGSRLLEWYADDARFRFTLKFELPMASTSINYGRPEVTVR